MAVSFCSMTMPDREAAALQTWFQALPRPDESADHLAEKHHLSPFRVLRLDDQNVMPDEATALEALKAHAGPGVTVFGVRYQANYTVRWALGGWTDRV